MHVSYELAQQIVDKAVEKSKQMGVKMCIAILDSGGNLKSFTRMDDAWVGSIDIAIKKAKTACHFAMPSGEIGKLSLPGQPLYGIEHSNDGLITFPGGLPIVDNEGMLVGAIGVSGDSVENDHIVAQAGVDVAGVCSMPKHPWRT